MNTEQPIVNAIEKRARGRVVAQEHYLERQRQRKAEMVTRIVEAIETFALRQMAGPYRLTHKQRQEICEQVCQRLRKKA